MQFYVVVNIRIDSSTDKITQGQVCQLVVLESTLYSKGETCSRLKNLTYNPIFAIDDLQLLGDFKGSVW